MLRKVTRFILSLLGVIIGTTLAWMLIPYLAERGINLIGYREILIYFLFGIAFGVLFFILSKSLIDYTVGFIRRVEQKLQEIPANDIIIWVSGRYNRL